MDPEAFLCLLSQDLGVAGVVVGRGFRFGYKAAGDTDLLARRGAQLGMEVGRGRVHECVCVWGKVGGIPTS